MGIGPGWRWFAAWAAAGALLAFSLVAAASVGLFVLPVAALALWAILRGSPPRWSAFGLVSGAGLVSMLVGALNRGSSPCPESGQLTESPGAGPVECGGLDGTPFLAAGVVLVLAGPALVAAARRRERHGRLG